MISSDGVRVRDLGMRRNTQVSALPKLRNLIRQGGYDVVHTHLYRACVYGRLAARMAGTPVVVATEHSIGETHLERRRMTSGVRALYLGTDRCCDATIAVSDAVAGRLRGWGVPDRKITVIPNGVDFDRVAFDERARAGVRAEFGIREDAFVVGVLGRLDPNKRFGLVIDAVAPLLGSGVKLLVAGDGPERAELRELARWHGVQEHVVFAGSRNDVAGVLSALDLFVAPSAQETFGLSVLEALASGLPALYTTCPALDGVPTERAHRISADPDELRGEVLAELATRGGRGEVPEIRRLYGIEAVTGRIDSLYEGLWARKAAVDVRGPNRTRAVEGEGR